MNTSAPDTAPPFRCGFVAIVGRPNVGKSTLLNHLVGQKISIVSSKAQTTRHRITGVLTEDHAQFVFVDTPGFQKQHQSALNRTMNRAVTTALAGVDAIVCVIEAGKLTAADRTVFSLLPTDQPVLLAVNKIDRIRDKGRLLPFLSEVAQAFPFTDIIPVSAQAEDNLPRLLDCLRPHLPEAAPFFAEDEITDRSERFLAAEFLREQLFRLLGDELPYGLAVEIEKFETEGNLRRIYAAVIVDRPGHKAIVIGKGGQHLKRISTQARQALEKLFDARIYLEVWVKVKGGWADDERALKSLGYDE